MLFSVVYPESMSNKFRSNRTGSRPGFDDALFTRSIEGFDFFEYAKINVRSFFETTSHKEKFNILEQERNTISPEVFQNEYEESNDLCSCGFES